MIFTLVPGGSAPNSSSSGNGNANSSSASKPLVPNSGSGGGISSAAISLITATGPQGNSKPSALASKMSSLYPEMRFSWEIKSVDALFCNGMTRVGDLSREAILQSLKDEDLSVLKDDINKNLFNDKKFCKVGEILRLRALCKI